MDFFIKGIVSMWAAIFLLGSGGLVDPMFLFKAMHNPQQAIEQTFSGSD